MTDIKFSGFATGARPLCGFCLTPWADDIIKVSAVSEVTPGLEGDLESVRTKATIKITCEGCMRLIYRKEAVGDTMEFLGMQEQTELKPL